MKESLLMVKILEILAFMQNIRVLSLSPLLKDITLGVNPSFVLKAPY